jgi:hypothetical protein
MKLVFAIFLLVSATPAMAQGVSNSRDGIVRDKGLASGNAQPLPMVNRAILQPQKPVVTVRQPSHR